MKIRKIDPSPFAKGDRVDKSDMRKVILGSPSQFRAVLESNKITGVGGEFNNIIICGVGGSALPGNILICWLNDLISQSPLPPIYIHRDYGLPSQADKNSLIICVSYSGNTEETVSALREAIDKKFKVAAIATGGKIGDVCKKHGVPWVKIPSGIQPRSATGYLFAALVKILIDSGIIEDKKNEVLRMAEELEKAKPEKEGKKLAKKLANKIPLIYSSNRFKCLARIWKIKFNENSKIPAFYNYFPELNHNEMVGFTNKKLSKGFHIIIIKDKNDHLRTLKRMNLFSALAKSRGIKADFINIKEGSILFKIFSTLLLGDWVSYYLALKYKIDPTPVKIVEDFKKGLK